MNNSLSITISGKKFLTTKSAAKLLACSPQYVRRLCSEGSLTCVTLGGAWHVAEDSFVKGKRIILKKRINKSLRATPLQLKNKR